MIATVFVKEKEGSRSLSAHHARVSVNARLEGGF